MQELKWKIPRPTMRLLYLLWRRQRHPTPVLLPGKSRGWRSLLGYSPWGHEESDTTERLHFHFSLSFTGEGNGNPLQCSCLENPRDRGAWWLPSMGSQSRTRLKRLSNMPTISIKFYFVFLQPAHPLTNHSFAHLLRALLLSVTGQNHTIYILTTVEPLGWAWAGLLLPLIFLHINTFSWQCWLKVPTVFLWKP